MQSVAETSAAIMERMRKAARMANSSDFEALEKMSTLDIERKKAEAYNRTPGKLNERDGYECKLCRNRGDFHTVKQGAGGMPVIYSEPCRCMTARHSLARLKRSGLADTIRECTFAAYEAAEDWQRNLKETAQRFTQDDEAKWFFVGGAVGGGKTHICTAICAHYLHSRPVHYMLWEEEFKRINAAINDGEEYARIMDYLKTIDVLYIDDLFKPVRRDGEALPPSGPEIKRAFELLNHRSISNAITIISSEWYSTEIAELDQALGGRIIKKARGYTLNIKRDPKRDYRIQGGELL